MFSIHLQALADRLGKNISQIAQETGLNRNTVTALYHGKVDGIKFATLEKLCEVYKVKVEDLLVYTPKEAKVHVRVADKMYKQEGEVIPFTMWIPHLAIESIPKEYFSERFGKTFVYFDKEYCHAYWSHDAMAVVAQAMYTRYSTRTAFDALYADFLRESVPVQTLYFASSQQAVSGLGEQAFLDFFSEACETFRSFWRMSIFIDGFDSGFDLAEIKRISDTHQLSLDEVAILTTPEQMTFGNERILALLEIAKQLLAKPLPKNGLKAHISAFVDGSEAVAKYMKDFNYYKSNYAGVSPITKHEVVMELLSYLRDEARFRTEYRQLKHYAKEQEKKIRTVLKKHGLTENPLYFFQRLTYWREYRKQLNLMSILVMFQVLHSLEERTGIPLKYLSYLSLDEVPTVLKGLVTKDALQQRYDGSMMVIAEGGGYKLLVGEEARSLDNELAATLGGANQQTTITGSIASQGYAKGIARVVLDQKDFGKFHEGEILVTGMTRPEFVPLMKKAGGIVTNEGGITCHAAIVSRELGKPCIIGTQVATQLIHDGDLIEVRAYHGTVRILERAK